MVPHNKFKIPYLFILMLFIVGCQSQPVSPVPTAVPTRQILAETPVPPNLDLAETQLTISSPDRRIDITFFLQGGFPYYQVIRDGVPVLLPSRLGFVFQNAPSLDRNLTFIDSEERTVDEIWTQPWGEAREIRNHYNELQVDLQETTANPRDITLIFRVYDDGIGFRYWLPEQDHLVEFEIMDELTEFALSGSHQAWFIEAYQDNRYEYLYLQAPVSFFARHTFNGVQTPLTIETTGGQYLVIHEANLTDYASMTLISKENYVLESDLVPWSDGVRVRGRTPFATPWRTVQIADEPGGLITSNLILNLNEPNQITDVSWIRPGKYIGIWWGMHIGKFTWGFGPDHGATTKNAQEYIDFAAQHGFEGVLIEGWNEGWNGDWTANGELFSFTVPYPDFDIEEVAAYARARGVKIIGHHETAAAITNYESQLEAAFALYRDLGIDTVKTGYVGWGQGIKRYDDAGEPVGLEWHHGQYMVRHYRKVIETAARYGIMLDVHEPIKDTGLRRTFPNMMTREGARGQEYNAWSDDGGNPPDHTTILPFTRMLSGPFDFTPGIFDLMLGDDRPGNRINTTLAKQLALYVVLYSPLHMAADLPENYEDQPAFQFILDVPVDWEITRVLNARIGDFVTVVRQDRNSEDWYLGSITDEVGRSFEAQLNFLEPDRMYVAEIYADGPEADWETDPYAMEIYRALVNMETQLKIRLAPGGGLAVRFRPALPEDLTEVAPYK